MSRIDCISNRNIRIIAIYLMSRLGHYDTLFESLPYPADRYKSPEDFFLNEDEWTVFENFRTIFRRAKEMSGEKYFYFNCGLSSANLKSWGRYEYFTRIFTGPDDGFKRLPFFNKNLNDTKDIEVIIPPHSDRASGKNRVILKVTYHADIKAWMDYISDPYRRGLISSIPTIWGLSPALIKQVLNQYDPEALLNNEPEFACLGLDARMEGLFLTIKNRDATGRRVVGKKVRLEPERISNNNIFMGNWRDYRENTAANLVNGAPILITDTVRVDNRIILKAGEIFNAPYFILDIKYDKLALINRIAPVFKRKRDHFNSCELFDTFNRLRETIEARNIAYEEIRCVNEELKRAKARLEEYNSDLEKEVGRRTTELKKAKEELLTFNMNLKEKVEEQVEKLNRYNNLRRYLSPVITDKILTSGGSLGAEPQRKMMTVLFSDIRNFSTFTDSLEPEELFHLLDGYLTEMIDIVHKYDGTLNKIIGDGLLIFFNDPIVQKDHAPRAVKMAIEMQKKVSALRHEWLQYGKDFGIGIGINTGYMTVGNIGSNSHMDYTVIGNQVNVASRLESIAEPSQILISQRTFSRVHDFVKVDKEESINVKGIHNPIKIYNVRID
ncbi:MAG: hypothetical protein JW882_17280 [Deltaproteobacteria bacterium]|nr:hypothetical protein [Deltaproteobacteria bacterium]